VPDRSSRREVVKRYGEALPRRGAPRDLRSPFPPEVVSSSARAAAAEHAPQSAGRPGRPTNGRVTIAGEDLATLSADARSDLRLRRIASCSRTWTCCRTFTRSRSHRAARLLGVGLAARLSAGRRAVLDALRVPASVHRRLRPISGRQQQRTAIARALVTEPQDPPGRRAHRQPRLGHRARDPRPPGRGDAARRLTVIMVTHSTFAATYGHRTIELAMDASCATSPSRPGAACTSSPTPIRREPPRVGRLRTRPAGRRSTPRRRDSVPSSRSARSPSAGR